MFRFSRICRLTARPVCHQHASAQQPTQAQRDAIRASCRSDFIANCSGVQPGGKEAFECLLRNEAKLSPSCQAAVSAAAPKPAEPPAAAAPATAAPVKSKTAPPAKSSGRARNQVAPAEDQIEELKTVQQAFTLDDLVSHCSWIAPNNPEILHCLKANAADLSPNCQGARAIPSARTAGRGNGCVSAGTAPAKKPARAKGGRAGTRQCSSAAHGSRRTCDANGPAESRHSRRMPFRFHLHCSGVQPGGAEALQCLKSNATQLSAACRSAVAAIGGGVRCGGTVRSTGGSGYTGGRAHRTDADAAPARRAGDRANLRCRSAVALCRCSVRRRPCHQLPRRKRVELVAELLRRAERAAGR